MSKNRNDRNTSGFGMALAILELVALSQIPAAALAQDTGVASLGATGGLNIPSAYVLNSGDIALSVGNYQAPQLSQYSHQQNFTLGFGMLPGVEIFGRVAQAQNDMSANLKWQLPLDVAWLPKLAVGATDQGGGASYFSSVYAVASDQYGPLRWTLGYAKGRGMLGAADGAKVLDGPFGGAEFQLGNTRATVIAETDGIQKHAGLRYYTEPLPWLGDGQLVGTVQRAFATAGTGLSAADALTANLSLVVPLGTSESTRKARADATPKPLAPVQPTPSNGMVATVQDRMEDLARALRTIGLDRVRGGTLGDSLWVIDYENYRYLQNEADALGIVLGLAAEFAPAGIAEVHVRASKAGQVVLEASTEVAAYRNFLRDGDDRRVKETLSFSRLTSDDAWAVQWASGEAGRAQHRATVRVELKPLLNYTLGTEFGVFDYSVAANVRGTATLWPGGEVLADVVQRLDNSENMDPGQYFSNFRHRDGLKSMALQQSFWLGTGVFTSVGVGRYNYGDTGAEAESVLFMPWNDDTLHLKGSYHRTPEDATSATEEAYAATYRWRFDNQTWVEGGLHRFTDHTTGTAWALTRRFGDAAVQIFMRKGGENTFVGMELSVPLAPRQGMGAAAVQLTGTPAFTLPYRTLLISGANSGNYIKPDAVRQVSLNYKLEADQLNSGRVNINYFKTQFQRMREAFYLYAREVVTE